MRNKALKLLRYITIYGFRRTLSKVSARSKRILGIQQIVKGSTKLGFIGTGQFATSTIGFFLGLDRRVDFYICYDCNLINSKFFSRKFKTRLSESYDVKDFISCDVVFVASNHSTHCDYALGLLDAGYKGKIYIEKPLATKRSQLEQLQRLDIGHRLYSGYNRPYSSAMSFVVPKLIEKSGAVSISCTVFGHFLDADHWYRKADEGTRISGNLGHWIDISMHIFLECHSNLEWIDITFACADWSSFDDNLVLVFTSNLGDIASVMMTSRSEPFEGIRENIAIQRDSLSIIIDDFRKTTIMDGAQKLKKLHRPKDVGHLGSLQRIFNDNTRWDQELLSSELTIHILEMARKQKRNDRYHFKDRKN